MSFWLEPTSLRGFKIMPIIRQTFAILHGMADHPYYILPRYHIMVETLLSGIVLGLMPVTLSGLFVTAYLQYRRGDQLNL
jgi:cytochrome b6-f complex subunit 5